MNKTAYRWLVATSLLGATVASQITFPSVVEASDKGTFTVGDSVLNVHRSPSTSGEKVATYQPGDKINYDEIVVNDGYRWISYVGASGNRNYVAVGTADGSQSFGSLSGASSSSSSASSSTNSSSEASKGQNFDFSSIAGTWVNGKGDIMEIDGDGHFNGDWSLTVEKIEKGKVGFYKDIDGGGIGTKTYGELLYAGSTTDSLSSTGDLSDKNRDRIFFAQYPGAEANEFYYRQEEAVTQTNETKKETKTVNNEPTEAEKEVIAKVWNQLGAKQYDFYVYRRPAGTPVNYYDGVGENYPEVTYLLAEDVNKSGNSNAMSTEVLFSDNGDGTITLYKYIKKWHFSPDKFEEATKEHLADTEIVKLEDISSSEQEAMLQLVTEYEGFENSEEDSTSETKDSQADKKDKATETKTESSSQEATKSSSSDEKTSRTVSSSSSEEEKELTSESGTSKAETTDKTSAKSGNAVQRLYKTLSGKKKLPSTGESVSVLGLIGAGLLAVALFLKNKFSEKKEK